MGMKRALGLPNFENFLGACGPVDLADLMQIPAVTKMYVLYVNIENVLSRAKKHFRKMFCLLLDAACQATCKRQALYPPKRTDNRSVVHGTASLFYIYSLFLCRLNP